MSNAKRIVQGDRALVIAGYGGCFRHPLEERPLSWWRRLLAQARRLLRREQRRSLIVRVP